jgi:hypothetical protein
MRNLCIFTCVFAFLSLTSEAMSASYVAMNLENCPNLTGTYQCVDPFGVSKTVVVSQEENRFVLNGLAPLDNLIADGLNHRVTNSSYYRNASYTANCLGDHILAKVRGDVYKDGFYLGNANVNVKLAKDTGNNLVSKVSGSLRGPLIQTPINENISCRKK